MAIRFAPRRRVSQHDLKLMTLQSQSVTAPTRLHGSALRHHAPARYVGDEAQPLFDLVTESLEATGDIVLPGGSLLESQLLFDVGLELPIGGVRISSSRFRIPCSTFCFKLSAMYCTQCTRCGRQFCARARRSRQRNRLLNVLSVGWRSRFPFVHASSRAMRAYCPARSLQPHIYYCWRNGNVELCPEPWSQGLFLSIFNFQPSQFG